MMELHWPYSTTQSCGEDLVNDNDSQCPELVSCNLNKTMTTAIDVCLHQKKLAKRIYTVGYKNVPLHFD